MNVHLINPLSLSCRTRHGADSPAMEFADGHPIGNGRIGMMCFGGPSKPMFAINHADLWYRPRVQAKPLPGCFRAIRRNALAGNWPRVNKAMTIAFDSWKPTPDGSFQPGAFLELWLQLRDGAWDYHRSLDIRTGVATTEFHSCGYRYAFQAFTHPVLPVATILLETENPEGWLGRLRLFRPPDDRFAKPTARSAKDRLQLGMHFPDGTSFEAQLRMDSVRFKHGSSRIQRPGETAKDASEATLGLPGARKVALRLGIDVNHGSRPNAGKMVVRGASFKPKPFAGEYLSRASIQLPGGAGNDVRSPAHYERLWNAGRYLFAASSWPGGRPPNLQGIWNERVNPPCDCDYHMDLNVQMALWHAPTGNLLEYHEPFFRLLDGMISGARKNARCFFEMRGLAFPCKSYGQGEGHHRVDAWVGTSGWLMQHYWKHWRYTLDETFLRERCQPLHREVSRFYLDYLVEDHGRLIIIPSESPENRLMDRSNGQYGRNSTFDLAVFRELFTHTVNAAEHLGEEDALIQEIRGALTKLSPYPRAADGRLREMEDYEFELGHRHMCQMYPLFPGDEMTPETPDLFQAARLALRHFRSWPPTGAAHWLGHFGEGAWAGWTYPLLACCHARLGEGDEALEMLKRYSKAFTLPSGLGLCFETHDLGFGQNSLPEIGKWIQIDAPLGVVAAVQEMLIQSHRGVIRLLPALPNAWPEGSFRGLRAEEGFEVDAEWRKGRLRVARIRSLLGRECRLKLPYGAEHRITDPRGRAVRYALDPKQRIAVFATHCGNPYMVHVKSQPEPSWRRTEIPSPLSELQCPLDLIGNPRSYG